MGECEGALGLIMAQQRGHNQAWPSQSPGELGKITTKWKDLPLKKVSNILGLRLKCELI